MDPLEQLTREVGAAIGEGPGPERRRRQRRAAAALTTGPIGHDLVRRWLLPLAVVAAALVLVWFGRGGPGRGSIEARVDDRPFAAGSWLTAEGEPRTLELPARGRVVVAPRSAARLVRAEAEGVLLNLERGRLEVVAEPSRPWTVTAGPFTVDGTGTRFTVEWQPEPRALTVAVEAGEVRVRGGTLPSEGSAIGANQRLEVRDVPAPVTAQAAASVEAEPAGEVHGPRRSREGSEWQRRAAAGEHAAALVAVERAGLASVLERADAEALDLLAHSARLAGATGTARAALETLRRRFPQDGRARTAAFVLGRIALEQEKDPDAAAGWFEVYVQEQPSGPLVEEARGRILEVRRASGDAAQVQAAARRYLEHHPEGSRARLARALLDPP